MRGTRIPDDFHPDCETAYKAGLSPSQAQTEAANFRDYWSAKAGANATKLDWPATWRMWCRNAASRLPKNKPPQFNPMTTAIHKMMAGNPFEGDEIYGQLFSDTPADGAGSERTLLIDAVPNRH